MSKKKNVPISYIRFFHAIKDPLAIYDIYIDDKLIYAYVLYEDFTKYLPLPSCFHHIRIHYHGKEDCLFEKKVTLPRNQIITYILAPTTNHKHPYHIYSLQDITRPYAKDICFGRFCHFAPCLPPLIIAGAEEKVLQNNLSYSLAGNYLPFKADTYTFEMLLKSTKESLYSPGPIKLKPYRFYTFYLIDDAKKEGVPKWITSIDGNSFLTFEKE